MDEHAHDLLCTIENESQHKECVICMHGGKLWCCDGKGCSRNFHLSCVDPPLTCVPSGVWHCIWCVKKKIEYGVHSMSQGEELILDSREVLSDNEVRQRQKQYLVKYKGLAHVHNRWIPERQLLQEAPMLLARFKKNYKNIKWKIEWSVPHRLLQKRMLLFPENYANHFSGHADNNSDCHYEWLVKWTDLNYDHATWELGNASFLRTPEAIKLIRDFESRHEKSKRSHPSHEEEGRKITCPELSEFSFGHLRGVLKCHLTYVHNLQEYWHRGQNAVVFDDKERVVKVVLFILSLQCDIRQPFLIITASTSLSLWEAEFSFWASSANIVVYKGDRDVRGIIRTLEFYNEGGCIMFQVLLSAPDVVGEDRRFNYHNVLSLLDPKFDGIDENALEIDPKFDICKLKERLGQYVAFDCISSTSKFAEYWVPAQLSSVQIEQYCASLLSNSMSLYSCLKNDSAGSLRDILILIRKCCDHPYLVDESLQSCVTSGLHVVDSLDVGISVSGKLKLLEKILLEIEKRGLRVVILFQSLGCSGPISIGDILDDFVHQRFGKDSYARIDREIVRSKNQAALNMFKNKESGKFVFLVENRACLQSIKLSSVDMAIIFNSNWNPKKDLIALQKITISSQFEQLKVFRLYSYCTVEEKVLILAKRGATLNSNIQNINRRTCHMLLSWGASYLFNKLDDFHGCKAPVSHIYISSEQSLLNNVLYEFSTLLPYNGENGNPTKCSIILNAHKNGGAYPRNVSLLGEVETQSMDNFSVIKQLMDNEPPQVFWTNLLEGRQPMLKYLSKPSQRIRRKVQLSNDFLEETEFEGDAVKNKCRKVFNRTGNLICPTRRLKNKRKVDAGVKEQELAGASGHSAGDIPCSTDNMHNLSGASDFLAMPRVAKNVSMECDGRDVVTLGEHITEVKHHSGAATLVSRETPTKASPTTAQSHIIPVQGSSLPSHHLPISITYPPNTEHGQADVPGSWRTQDLHSNGEQAQVQRQPSIDDSTGIPSSSVLQPITHVPLMLVSISESDVSNLRRTTTVPESGDNQHLLASLVTSEVLQSACLDPLQMEMERIQKDKEQAIKMHEDKKLKLKSECDKEIAEALKKYAALLQEAEMELVQRKKDLETYHNKVYMNKFLAEALTLKHNTTDAIGSPEMQQVTVSGIMNEIFQTYCQQTAAMTTLRLDEQLTASLLMTGPPVTPSAWVVNHSSGVQPNATSSIPTLPIPALPTFQSGSVSMIHQPESAGVYPVMHGYLSAAELPMGIRSCSAADPLNRFFPL